MAAEDAAKRRKAYSQVLSIVEALQADGPIDSTTESRLVAELQIQTGYGPRLVQEMVQNLAITGRLKRKEAAAPAPQPVLFHKD